MIEHFNGIPFIFIPSANATDAQHLVEHVYAIPFQGCILVTCVGYLFIVTFSAIF